MLLEMTAAFPFNKEVNSIAATSEGDFTEFIRFAT
jgi:hypothetical protein